MRLYCLRESHCSFARGAAPNARGWPCCSSGGIRPIASSVNAVNVSSSLGWRTGIAFITSRSKFQALRDPFFLTNLSGLVGNTKMHLNEQIEEIVW